MLIKKQLRQKWLKLVDLTWGSNSQHIELTTLAVIAEWVVRLLKKQTVPGSNPAPGS